MERSIHNLSDITYMSELTLDIFERKKLAEKCQGLNSRRQLTHPEVSGFVNCSLI